ncbi:hypothetical protein L915_02902 [Phytophthora nicotianae]|uniref:Uncharacterized protein n=1 Tax=Phytophthora nicotianae TaxID=4792 RepID=W2JP11_PHYNI|nr:hypothetical protein L915_02902 [Phytophthora nicotianae]ETL47373.1 hypothetical protein L916_02879 [Phytophthora nicotianae]
MSCVWVRNVCATLRIVVSTSRAIGTGLLNSRNWMIPVWLSPSGYYVKLTGICDSRGTCVALVQQLDVANARRRAFIPSKRWG